MAHYLKQSGVNNITVYEKEDYKKGKHGKVYTTYTNDAPDIPVEMGAGLIGPHYFAVNDLLFDLDMDMHDDSFLWYTSRVKTEVYDAHRFHGSKDSIDFVADAIHDVLSEDIPVLRYIPQTLTLPALWVNIQRYASLRQAIFPSGIRPYTIPPAIESRLFALSFASWLEENGLQALYDYVTMIYCDTGYPHPDRVSAFYALCFLHEDYLDPWKHIAVLRRGWGSVFEHMIERDDIHIVYGRSPTAVKRYKDRVVVEDTVSSESYDYLIIATPPDATLQYLDVTPEESLLMSTFKGYTYKTTMATVCVSKAEEKIGNRLFAEGFLASSPMGRLSLSYAPAAYAGAEMKSHSRTEVFYQADYDNILNEQQMQKILDRQMLRYGIKTADEKAERLEHSCVYAYNAPLDASCNIYDMLRIQGDNRTLHVHAAWSFESINDVTAYCRLLVDCLFP